MLYLNLGRREVGKTTLAAFLVHTYKCRVIFDPRALFPSSHRVTRLQDIEPAIDTLFDKQAGEVVITPDAYLQTCFERMASEVKAWLKDSDTPIACVVDELRFVDTDVDDFDWILRCAPRSSVCIVMTAHRPSDVPTDVRSIADAWCIFQTVQEHDIKVISERCSERVAALAPALKPREFIVWDDTKGKHQEYRNPAAWYVPLDIRGSRPAATGDGLKQLDPSDDTPPVDKQTRLL